MGILNGFTQLVSNGRAIGNHGDSLNVAITAQDNPTIDAFGRIRSVNPFTLFDSKQIFDNAPLFWDDQEVSGSGTSSSHSVATASSTLSVSATTAGRRVRQTFMRFNYQPAKSQLVFMTGTLTTAVQSGIKRCMGIYDDDNGIFFCDDGGTIKAVIRSSTSGSPVDTEVAQTNWNLDKLDGTGGSGVTLDPTKSQIMVLDFEWLGVGRVRIGFVVDGLIIYAHEFLNANNLAGVYMSTPNLPLRYEIVNDGTGGASSLECICSSVVSEGGQEKNGILRHTDSGSLSTLSNGTEYAVLGIRLKSTHVGATISLAALSLLAASTNDKAHWELRLNPTVTGTFTYSDVTNSAVQIASGAGNNPTVSGGVEIDGGYFTTSLPATNTIPNAIRLGSAIDGTVDEIVLVAKPITNNITVEGSLTWRELV